MLSSCQKRIPDVADQNKTACEKLVYTLRQRHSFSSNCIYRERINNRINHQITLSLSFFLTQLSFSFVLSHNLSVDSLFLPNKLFGQLEIYQLKTNLFDQERHVKNLCLSFEKVGAGVIVTMGTEERHNFEVFHHFSLGFYLKQGQPLILTPVETQKTLQLFPPASQM